MDFCPLDLFDKYMKDKKYRLAMILAIMADLPEEKLLEAGISDFYQNRTINQVEEVGEFEQFILNFKQQYQERL